MKLKSTKMKDKNGRTIYEKDCVSWIAGYKGDEEIKENKIIIFVQQKNKMMWALSSNGRYDGAIFNDWEGKDVEVINSCKEK